MKERPSPGGRSRRSAPPGLEVVALASASSLLTSLALTRLLSVLTWYHFAFAVISLTLLGLGLGSSLVALAPRRLAAGRVETRVATAAALGSLAGMGLLFLALRVPLQPRLEARALAVSALYAVLALAPFAAVGVVLAECLRAGRERTGAVYAADLMGAAAGAVCFIPAASLLGAPGALALAAAGLGVAALRAARGAPPRRLLPVGLPALLALLGCVAARTTDLTRPRWAKMPGLESARESYWNAYSFVTVSDHPRAEAPGAPPGRRLRIVIDLLAATILSEFDGDPRSAGYLLGEVASAVYAVKPGPGRLLVIGVGGGRDLLAGLAAGAGSVTGVEMNGAILGLLTGPYRDLAGLASRPEVRLVHDEARSFVERAREPYDVIQATLIDTWAASTSGAFALAENGLYTRDAWSLFLERLAPGGVLTVTRWYEGPRWELQRSVSLALAALAGAGAVEPARHVMVVRSDRLGTLLVKREPFTAGEREALVKAAARFGWEPVFVPGREAGAGFEALAGGAAGWWRFVAGHRPEDLSPPGDDRPFFFYRTRPEEWLDLTGLLRPPGAGHTRTHHTDPKHVLVWILALTLAGALGLLVLPPLLVAGREREAAPAPRALLYMAAIGLGYMLVEIPLLTRLAIVLGHPVVSLVVVLAGLLVASGLGSLGSGRLGPRSRRAVLAALGPLVAGLALGLGHAAALLGGLAAPSRIAGAGLLVFLTGVPMGVALPAGLIWAGGARARAVPILFGVNGAFSVLGSVLATVCALNAGIRVTLLAGALAYGAAFLLLGTGGSARGRRMAP